MFSLRRYFLFATPDAIFAASIADYCHAAAIFQILARYFFALCCLFLIDNDHINTASLC